MGDLVGSRTLGINSDPSLVLQQALMNREKQFTSISNPQQQLAARLGSMLGGGITNLVNDRGFFEVNDPLLNKVTKIQGIYSDVASKIDPAANPEQFYKALQQAYSQDPELGQQALMAAQEAQKAKTAGLDLESKQLDLYKKNPDSILKDITKLRDLGRDDEAAALERLNTRLQDEIKLDKRKAEAGIARDVASAEQSRALAAKYGQGEFTYRDERNSRGEVIGTAIFKDGKKVGSEVPAPAAPKDKDKPVEKKEGSAYYMTPGGSTATAAPTANVSQAGASAGSPATIVANNNYQTTPLVPYNSQTKVYDLTKDPLIAGLLANRQSQSNPQAVAALDQALQAQFQRLVQQYPGVQFVGGQ